MRPEELKERVLEVGFAALGQRLFRLRSSRGLSIRALAEQAQVSKNTVMRLEKGMPIQPETLRFLVRGLRIRLEDLLSPEFSEGTPITVHRATQEVWYDLHRFRGVEESEPLSGRPFDAGVLPICLLSSRDRSGFFNPNVILLTQATETRSHRGEEFAMVLEGRMRIVFDDREIELAEGDSVYFWAAERHRYEPVAPGETARLLSIVLDPFPVGVALDRFNRTDD